MRNRLKQLFNTYKCKQNNNIEHEKRKIVILSCTSLFISQLSPLFPPAVLVTCKPANLHFKFQSSGAASFRLN